MNISTCYRYAKEKKFHSLDNGTYYTVHDVMDPVLMISACVMQKCSSLGWQLVFHVSTSFHLFMQRFHKVEQHTHRKTAHFIRCVSLHTHRIIQISWNLSQNLTLAFQSNSNFWSAWVVRIRKDEIYYIYICIHMLSAALFHRNGCY